MFKHILLPTDGSPGSDNAVQAGLRLAAQVGARVTALHVVPPFRTFTYLPDMIEDTEEQYDRESDQRARTLLQAVEKQAQESGVPCDSVVVRTDDVYDAIIETARDRQCDLITMASHGRRGVRGLLLGSETQKVLTHSLVPVLVFR